MAKVKPGAVVVPVVVVVPAPVPPSAGYGTTSCTLAMIWHPALAAVTPSSHSTAAQNPFLTLISPRTTAPQPRPSTRHHRQHLHTLPRIRLRRRTHRHRDHHHPRDSRRAPESERDVGHVGRGLRVVLQRDPRRIALRR